MKISNFGEWISDNKENIVGCIVILTLISGLILLLSHIPRLSEGTLVTVVGTDIHGVVTKVDNDDVEISCVSSNGIVKTMTYNINLLQVNR